MSVVQTWPPSGVPAIAENCCPICYRAGWTGGKYVQGQITYRLAEAGSVPWTFLTSFALSETWGNPQSTWDSNYTDLLQHRFLDPALTGEFYVVDTTLTIGWRWVQYQMIGGVNDPSNHDPSTWDDGTPQATATLTGCVNWFDGLGAWDPATPNDITAAAIGAQSGTLSGSRRITNYKLTSGGAIGPWFVRQGPNRWVTPVGASGTIDRTATGFSQFVALKCAWTATVTTYDPTSGLPPPLTVACHLGAPITDTDVTAGGIRRRTFHRGPLLP